MSFGDQNSCWDSFHGKPDYCFAIGVPPGAIDRAITSLWERKTSVTTTANPPPTPPTTPSTPTTPTTPTTPSLLPFGLTPLSWHSLAPPAGPVHVVWHLRVGDITCRISAAAASTVCPCPIQTYWGTYTAAQAFIPNPRADVPWDRYAHSTYAPASRMHRSQPVLSLRVSSTRPQVYAAIEAGFPGRRTRHVVVASATWMARRAFPWLSNLSIGFNTPFIKDSQPDAVPRALQTMRSAHVRCAKTTFPFSFCLHRTRVPHSP